MTENYDPKSELFTIVCAGCGCTFQSSDEDDTIACVCPDCADGQHYDFLVESYGESDLDM